uniref:E(Spl)/hairy-a hairy E(SPL) like bHLH transcription factor n=1 Tax=Phallusia mammillata TaxID=59560 RepID=A0A6F9DF19_9ASCI|nr:E(spl)/hairy-a hairy E(SPL) like bHLH transcription factor [Phallusia mammillata]
MPPERRMTEAEMRRKTNKPIMEKKRRERINKCLEDLKTIVLGAVSEDSRPNKLEKADILEMTVRYLKSVQSGKPIPMDLLPSNTTQTSEGEQQPSGYAQCVKDISQFLNKNEGVSVKLRTQLLGHLADKCNPVKESSYRNEKRQRCSPYHRPSLSHFPQRLMTELDLRNQSCLDESANFSTAASFAHFAGANISGDSTQHSVSLSSPLCRHTNSRFSPVPVSPISNPSTTSPSACREIPSPSLSSSSHRSEDSVGDVASSSPDSLLQCTGGIDSSLFSPITSHIDRKPHRFLDGVHLHYVSSDSGHWSSGSNPPSPIGHPLNKTKELALSKMRTNQRDTKPKIKLETTLQSTGMWRPWGI